MVIRKNFIAKRLRQRDFSSDRGVQRRDPE